MVLVFLMAWASTPGGSAATEKAEAEHSVGGFKHFADELGARVASVGKSSAEAVVVLTRTAIVTGRSVLLWEPVRTVASLEKVDDSALFRMRYRGTYHFELFARKGIDWWVYRTIGKWVNPEACASFTASTPEGNAIFGRNFDWNHRACLLLFTDPPGGYASVSTVDLYYLGLEGMHDIPWFRRLSLLAAPYAPIDGMNECGLAIAGNMVPSRGPPMNSERPTLEPAQLKRLVLDHARDVDEALALIQAYNVHFALVPEHFHIADASGKSAIVECVDGRVVVIRDAVPWQVSTNFLISEKKPKGATSHCRRYNTAYESLAKAAGSVSQDEAMRLLETISQSHTMWSVVYNLSTGEIRLAMGRNYDRVHTFQLKMKAKREPGGGLSIDCSPHAQTAGLEACSSR